MADAAAHAYLTAGLLELLGGVRAAAQHAELHAGRIEPGLPPAAITPDPYYGAPRPGRPGRWVVTFGEDHWLRVVNTAEGMGPTPPGWGIPLARRYVIIDAPGAEAARAEILERFGPGCWAAMYPAAQATTAAMIAALGLRELVL
jgi:hypothetical protein